MENPFPNGVAIETQATVCSSEVESGREVMLKTARFVIKVGAGVILLFAGSATVALLAPRQFDRLYQLTFREMFATKYASGCREGIVIAGYADHRGSEFCGCMVSLVNSMTVQEVLRSTFDHTILSSAHEARVCARLYLYGRPAGALT